MIHLNDVRVIEMHKEKKNCQNRTPPIMSTYVCDSVTNKRGLEARLNY